MTSPMYEQSEAENWHSAIWSALRDFSTVSELAGDRVVFGGRDVEFLPAPHAPPSRLPKGKMAVYGFWLDDDCLKIGKAGPNSHARFASQHYNIKSAGSTLAKSLTEDRLMYAFISGLENHALRDWIKRETSRVHILLPSTKSKILLSLLEAFLHARLRPRYEG